MLISFGASNNGPAKIADPSTIAAQVCLIYVVAWLWFFDGVPGVWNDIVLRTDLGGFLISHGTKSSVDTSGSPYAAFAYVCAATHSALVLLGLWLGNQAQSLSPVRRLCGGALVLVLVWTALQLVLRIGFEANLFAVRSLADSYFDDQGGLPFALIGSTSMTSWLCVACLLGQADQRIKGLFPEVVTRYLPWVVAAWAVGQCFFRFLCVPLWNSVLRRAAREYLFPQADPLAFPEVPTEYDSDALARLASCTHTLSLALGVATCGVTNLALRHIRGASQHSTTSQIRDTSKKLAICTVLIAAFVFAFWQWLSFATTRNVAHVTNATRAFFGSWADYVPAHLIVLASYVLWFGGGVLFEQMWHASASNDPPPPVKNGGASDSASDELQSVQSMLTVERGLVDSLTRELAAAKAAVRERQSAHDEVARFLLRRVEETERRAAASAGDALRYCAECEGSERARELAEERAAFAAMLAAAASNAAACNRASSADAVSQCSPPAAPCTADASAQCTAEAEDATVQAAAPTCSVAVGCSVGVGVGDAAVQCAPSTSTAAVGCAPCSADASTQHSDTATASDAAQGDRAALGGPPTAERVAAHAFATLVAELSAGLGQLQCEHPCVEADAKGYSVVFPMQEVPSAPVTDFLRRRLNPKLKEQHPFKGRCVRVNLLSLKDASEPTQFGAEMLASYGW
eukprot:TRINITY_DN15007_c0_g3_i1.p1 TRINITY_DN15007_c0_g3~~TRINITY_DN15007_c0_g3_i1.p1  ORF type:complete len:712 (+),score=198.76 TRINITY_DN15007_c0_g3_i1:72-2138(+)